MDDLQNPYSEMKQKPFKYHTETLWFKFTSIYDVKFKHFISLMKQSLDIAVK